MYFTSTSSLFDNSFDNRLNLLSKVSWSWSGIAPIFKTFVFECKGEEIVEKNNRGYKYLFEINKYLDHLKVII